MGNILDKGRIVKQVVHHKKNLAFVLFLLGILLSLGFLLADTKSEDYRNILDLADYRIWGTIFFSYAICKLLSISREFPFIFNAIVSVIGLWLWSYILIEFVFFSPTPLKVVEVLLILPVFTEIWYLTALIYKRESAKWQ